MQLLFRHQRGVGRCTSQWVIAGGGKQRSSPQYTVCTANHCPWLITAGINDTVPYITICALAGGGKKRSSPHYTVCTADQCPGSSQQAQTAQRLTQLSGPLQVVGRSGVPPNTQEAWFWSPRRACTTSTYCCWTSTACTPPSSRSTTSASPLSASLRTAACPACPPPLLLLTAWLCCPESSGSLCSAGVRWGCHRLCLLLWGPTVAAAALLALQCSPVTSMCAHARTLHCDVRQLMLSNSGCAAVPCPVTSSVTPICSRCFPFAVLRRQQINTAPNTLPTACDTCHTD